MKIKKKIPSIVSVILLKYIIDLSLKTAILITVIISIVLTNGLTEYFRGYNIQRTFTPQSINGNTGYQITKGKNLIMWHAKPTGGYSIYSNEGIENALMIRNQMRGYGWTDNAISAVVGNICAEGGLNPWRWQSDIIVGPSDFWSNQHGYGLAGFTPAGKYIEDPDAQTYAGYAPNYLNHAGQPSDGAAQIEFIKENPQYYQTHAAYPMTFQDFSISTLSPAYLSDVWLYNFEQPAHPEDTQQYRRDCSEYWYDIFTGSPYISDGDIIPCLVAMKVLK